MLYNGLISKYLKGCFIDGDPVNGGGPAPEKTFTQAELDAIIGERLSRERQKYADYDELKGISDELETFGYRGTASEKKAVLRAQAEEARKKAELEELQNEAQQTGTTPELLSEIRQLKAELTELKKDKEAANAAREAQKRAQERAQVHLAEFGGKYPDIDIDALLKNEKFGDFIQASNPNLTLVQIYERYKKLVGEAEAEALTKIKSNIDRSTSSGRDRGDSSGGTYGLTAKQQELAKEGGMTNKEYADFLKHIKR